MPRVNDLGLANRLKKALPTYTESDGKGIAYELCPWCVADELLRHPAGVLNLAPRPHAGFADVATP